MEKSKIEWTDHTFNPWWGCEKVSAGCKHCYAETLDNRYHHDAPHWGTGSSRMGMSPAHWKKPIQWNAEAATSGSPSKVFCASMADVFEDHPMVLEWRERMFETIELTPNLTWQMLTKRPQNIMKLAPNDWQKDGYPKNVWMGTSVENQEQAQKRIPHLLKAKAHTLYLSCEPLLGDVNLERVDCNDTTDDMCMVNALSGHHTDMGRPCIELPRTIDWVIVGAESGHGNRMMADPWAIDIKNQCQQNGTAFFMKQMIGVKGRKIPFESFPKRLQLRQFPIFVRKTFNSSLI